MRANLNVPKAERQPYQYLRNEFARRVAWSAGYLTQYELGYGWRDYAAKTQETADERSGANAGAKWKTPPLRSTLRQAAYGMRDRTLEDRRRVVADGQG